VSIAFHAVNVVFVAASVFAALTQVGVVPSLTERVTRPFAQDPNVVLVPVKVHCSPAGWMPLYMARLAVAVVYLSVALTTVQVGLECAQQATIGLQVAAAPA
jgi:hypothetical protein